MGITIFGGSTGELRYDDKEPYYLSSGTKMGYKGSLKLADLDGHYDGGDGADHDWGMNFYAENKPTITKNT